MQDYINKKLLSSLSMNKIIYTLVLHHSEQIKEIMDMSIPLYDHFEIKCWALKLKKFGTHTCSRIISLDLNTFEIVGVNLSGNNLQIVPNSIYLLKTFIDENRDGQLSPKFYLDLSNNKISELPINITKMDYINKLNLSNNHFTKLPIYIPAIKNLDIYNQSKSITNSITNPLTNSLANSLTIDIYKTKLICLLKKNQYSGVKIGHGDKYFYGYMFSS